MKLIFFVTFLILSSRLLAQSVLDGPYVRYDHAHILVTTIAENDDQLTCKISSYDSKKEVVLNVVPQGHPDWTFSVKLRDTLTNDPVAYVETKQVLFVSDIEGEFANFRQLLLAAGVIDDHYNWTYGKGAVVIPGDLFDRGKDVVPELWLLYKLEDEAKTKGGSMQMILGNHDIMNLSGDHRYTDQKYFKSAGLLQTGISGLFEKDTELGRWLRTKNVIEKIGDVLVMHGGMSPEVLQKGWTLAQLNTLSRPWYDFRHDNILDSLQVLFGKNALFWYRGYFMQPKATMGLVDSTLLKYNCKTIIVGHTIIKKNIASYFQGKVIGIDIDEHAAPPQGLLLKKGKWYVMDGAGKLRPLVYDPENDDISDSDIL